MSAAFFFYQGLIAPTSIAAPPLYQPDAFGTPWLSRLDRTSTHMKDAVGGIKVKKGAESDFLIRQLLQEEGEEEEEGEKNGYEDRPHTFTVDTLYGRDCISYTLCCIDATFPPLRTDEPRRAGGVAVVFFRRRRFDKRHEVVINMFPLDFSAPFEGPAFSYYMHTHLERISFFSFVFLFLLPSSWSLAASSTTREPACHDTHRRKQKEKKKKKIGRAIRKNSHGAAGNFEEEEGK